MSKKHKHERRARAGAAAAAAPAVHAQGEHLGGTFAIPDEVLHAPKEKSKLQFALMILLLIVLLLIFAVPGGILGWSSFRSRNEPVVFSWNRPGHGSVEVTIGDFQNDLRAFSQAFAADPLPGYSLGVQSDRDLDTATLARILVLEQLAADAGLQISDADLAEHLRGMLDYNEMLRSAYNIALPTTVAEFKTVVRQLGGDQHVIEETIRRALAASRYLQLTGYVGAIPDPADIEKSWKDEHVELAYEYVSLAPSSLEKEARAGLPDEAGLKAWFEALDETAKEELKTAEKRKAEFALFEGIEETPAAELVAAFPPEPPPDGAAPPSAEQLARDYYDRVFHRRFKKPAEPEDAQTPDDAHDHDHDAQRVEFYPVEEVQERAQAEAPVYFALQRWLQDMTARRAAGETVDLATEAAKYGLAFRALDAPLTREELLADPTLGDNQVADAVFGAAPDGGFHFVPVVLEDAIAVARTTERAEPVLPPFEEIRDKVADRWAEPKARELALERLKAIRDGFEEFVPEKKEGEPDFPEPEGTVHRRASAEAFAAAVQTAGLELQRRDWLDRAAPATTDPEWEKPAHRYLATQGQLYRLEEGELAEPGLARDESAAYLVRVAGKREVPIDRMSPVQYERYKTLARQRAMAEMTQKIDRQYLEKNYGLALARGEEEEAEPDAEDRPAEEAAGSPAADEPAPTAEVPEGEPAKQ